MRARKTLRLDGHLAGVAVPVSALQSQESCGIGEFLDLPALGGWIRDIGFDLIQILPVNDTGANPSPYSAVSAFALHPVYIRLQRLPGSEAVASRIRAFKEAGDRRGRVDFEATLGFKLDVLHDLFRSQQVSAEALEEWILENRWVKTYAVYKCLKEQNNRHSWTEWASARDLNGLRIDQLWHELGDESLFHAWVQFHLDGQLLEAVDRLEQAGVYLKGDIPILMNVDSADVWAHRKYFDLNFRAGAPPDMFSTLGQMWGFPVYDWPQLEEDDYIWWRRRLEYASRYYHAFRIDHVLGFFRLWSVPATEFTAVLGRYRPASYLSTIEIQEAVGSKDALRQLTEAHFRPDWLADVHEDEGKRIQETYFAETAPGQGRLRVEFAGESVIAGLSENDVVKEFLASCHRDRTFVEADSGEFAPAWFWRDSGGYLSASDELKSRIEELVERYETRSKPVWLEMGRRLLQVVRESGTMLACAEDLGVVPEGLPEVLAELGILSLKIERWEIDDQGLPADPASFPYLSVSTPAVHDTSAIRGWWEEDGWDKEAFCHRLGLDECPSWLTPDAASAIIRRSLQSNSAIRVFQLQDLFSLTLDLRTELPHDERINTPGSLNGRNWSYSMPIPLEVLVAHQLTKSIRDLVAEGRRENG